MATRTWKLPGTSLGVRLAGTYTERLSWYLEGLRLVETDADDSLPCIDVLPLDTAQITGDRDPQVVQKDDWISISASDGRVEFQAGRPGSRLHLIAALPDEPVALGVALFRALLHHGAVWTHALAFELDGRSCLVLGPSGSGKSTLAAAVLSAGGVLVSDDAVLIEQDARGQIRAHSLRSFARFRAPAHRLLPPSLACQLHPSERPGSWYLDFSDMGTQQDLSTVPDSLWLLGTRHERPLHSSAEPASQASGLSHWIEATIPCFFHSAWPTEQLALLRTIGDWLTQLSSHELLVGCSLMDTPGDALRDLLALTGPTAPHAGRHGG